MRQNETNCSSSHVNIIIRKSKQNEVFPFLFLIFKFSQIRKKVWKLFDTYEKQLLFVVG